MSIVDNTSKTSFDINNCSNSSNSDFSQLMDTTNTLYKAKIKQMNAITLTAAILQSPTIPNTAYTTIHDLILNIVSDTFGPAAAAEVFDKAGSPTIFNKYAEAMSRFEDLKLAKKIGDALVWHTSYDGNTVASKPVLSIVVRFVYNFIYVLFCYP